VALAAGAGFVAAAVASALIAADDLRALAVADALSGAEAVGAWTARGEAALYRADDSLASGVPTGELRDLAAARALLADPPDLDTAERRTWEALQRSPARAEAWARLAYIDLRRDGRLGPQGESALALSYEVEPYASEELRHWRVEFVLTHWEVIGPEVRDAALREAYGAVSAARDGTKRPSG
jgi:hypothetical protein